jgi:hypothetical protein
MMIYRIHCSFLCCKDSVFFDLNQKSRIFCRKFVYLQNHFIMSKYEEENPMCGVLSCGRIAHAGAE